MPNARLWHERSTFRYVLIGVLLAFASGFFSYLFNIHSGNRTVTEEKAHSNGPLGVVSHRIEPETPRAAAAGDVNRQTDDLVLQGETLTEQDDALNARLAAVEASLHARARDLGDTPLKPEISGAIATSRLDLQAAREALSRRDYAQASARMTRAQKLLQYLESL